MEKELKFYLDFSLDFDGEVEFIDDVDKGDMSIVDDVSESDLSDFVEGLKKVEGFMVSDHRTEVRVWVYDDTMDVRFNYYNEPDDGEFDTYELKGIPITPEMKLDELGENPD